MFFAQTFRTLRAAINVANAIETGRRPARIDTDVLGLTQIVNRKR